MTNLGPSLLKIGDQHVLQDLSVKTTTHLTIKSNYYESPPPFVLQCFKILFARQDEFLRVVQENDKFRNSEFLSEILVEFLLSEVLRVSEKFLEGFLGALSRDQNTIVLCSVHATSRCISWRTTFGCHFCDLEVLVTSAPLIFLPF